MRKEYETQMEYRKHLQAFIDRWRYNANRGGFTIVLFSKECQLHILLPASQAQMKIKILEKVLKVSAYSVVC